MVIKVLFDIYICNLIYFEVVMMFFFGWSLNIKLDRIGLGFNMINILVIEFRVKINKFLFFNVVLFIFVFIFIYY